MVPYTASVYIHNDTEPEPTFSFKTVSPQPPLPQILLVGKGGGAKYFRY